MHIRYLQEVYTATLVKSHCDESVSKWFRTIANNTSTFTPQVCETIKTAAELAKSTEGNNQEATCGRTLHEHLVNIKNLFKLLISILHGIITIWSL